MQVGYISSHARNIRNTNNNYNNYNINSNNTNTNTNYMNNGRKQMKIKS